MMSAAPLVYEWTGDSMRPLGVLAREADRQFVIGQRYRMENVEERSTSSHNHEFAWLKEAWQSLPESVADQYPSPEHLRKRALIEAGYFDEQIIDAGTAAAALRVAAYARGAEEFALVIVRGPVVVVRRPKSQSRRAMDKADFQASKTALMQVIADLLGVEVDQLRSDARRAA